MECDEWFCEQCVKTNTAKMCRTVSVNITNRVCMTHAQELNNLQRNIPQDYVEVKEKFSTFGKDEPIMHLKLFAAHANDKLTGTKTTTDNPPITLPPNAKSTGLSTSRSVIDKIASPALTRLGSKRKKPADAVPKSVDLPAKKKVALEKTAADGKKGIYQLYTFIYCI